MKFEKINTKIVVAVGVAIILVLTLVYVIFSTDIIIKHKPSGEDTNTNSNSNAPVISEDAKNRTKDVNSLSAEEKKYIIEQNFSNYLGELETTILEQLKKDCENDKKCPFEIDDYLEYTKEPPTKITGCSGRISLSYNKDEAGIDMSAVSCTSGNPNTNIEDDPEESNSNVYDGTGKISDAVKNRQKIADTLTAYERMYIASENLLNDIMSSTAQDLNRKKENCVDPTYCNYESAYYNYYTHDANKGYFFKECSGKINVVYVPGVIVVGQNTKGALKVVKDTDNLKNGEIRLSDARPHLSSKKVETGDYVKKNKVKVYTKTQNSANALKVVADTKKPGAKEIRISNVRNRVYSSKVEVGDFVAVTDIDAYVAADKNDKDALKVVADFRTPEKGEIKVSAVRPYIDESPIKVGDYVTEGIFVTDSSKVVCK